MPAMNDEQIIVFAILAALFGLLVWGRWRYDVVAFAALLAAVIAGVVPAREAFSGFGHPATITVAAVLILSQALGGAGAMDLVAKAVARAAKRPVLHVAALGGVGAVLSGFINNIGTLGLLMPVALDSARRAKRSPALLLMPLSFATILGGMVTLIGTPPNIIVAASRAEATGAPFGMFDFTPVGGVTALAGLVFLATVGWRLVPKAAVERGSAERHFDISDYVTEARVARGSKADGLTLGELYDQTKDNETEVIAVIRRKRRLASLGRGVALRAGDHLLLRAGPEELEKFTKQLDLKLAGSHDKKNPLDLADTALVEAVVTPHSRVVGRTAGMLRLTSRYGARLIAVARRGQPHRGRLRDVRFRTGDVLLLYGEAETVNDAVAALDCLPIAGRGLAFGRRHHALWLVAIFAAAIALLTAGVLSAPVALTLAVTVMVATGLFPLRELYEAIDWPVIVLLGALIPVGGALQTSGATDLIADAILQVTAALPPAVVLALLMVVTMTLSDLLNNAATAVVMAPIGVAIAGRLGASPDPFLMAVAVGASCAFLSPIGHQNNALIMAPGGYRFGDYWRMGLPLEILIVAVATPTILLVWPL